MNTSVHVKTRYQFSVVPRDIEQIKLGLRKDRNDRHFVLFSVRGKDRHCMRVNIAFDELALKQESEHGDLYEFTGIVTVGEKIDSGRFPATGRFRVTKDKSKARTAGADEFVEF